MRVGLAKRRIFHADPKVFVVGFNKTGTTSMGAALDRLGYRVGDQSTSELLMHDWAKRRFDSIIEFARTADAFQDVPFSLDFTFQRMDIVFPGSKFILTVRPSDKWYASLLGHHQRLLGIDRIPTVEDLRACTYRREGWLLEANQLIFGVRDADLYDRDRYVKRYERHNDLVVDYFQARPESLLVVDLSMHDAFSTIAGFLGKPLPDGTRMPHCNRAP